VAAVNSLFWDFEYNLFNPLEPLDGLGVGLVGVGLVGVGVAGDVVGKILS
jgi:hypothetical protein